MKDGARVVMPPSEWPTRDRECWTSVTAPVTSLYGPGAQAARLSKATVKLYQQSLGCWFGFLARFRELPPHTGLALITPARLDRYVDDQRARHVSNTTIRMRLQGLHGAVSLMLPAADFGFIMRPGGLALSIALPSTPRAIQIKGVAELLSIAQDLFVQGEARQGYAGGMVAFRDAALLGILATSAPRRRSLHEMELGRHISQRGPEYWLNFEDGNMKGGQRQGYPLPATLTPMLDAYIQVARPALGGASAQAFWIGPGGRAIAPGTIYQIVTRRTLKAFGHRHGPHWFRTCLTTEAALDSPGSLLDVSTRLGHSPGVSLKHYNQASAVAAAKRHDANVSELMKATKLLAEQAFAKRLQQR